MHLHLLINRSNMSGAGEFSHNWKHFSRCYERSRSIRASSREYHPARSPGTLCDSPSELSAYSLRGT
jgi:hypothetical protein